MGQGGEARPDRTAQGIGLILTSVMTMAFADAVVKLLSADMTLWQIFAARSLFAVLTVIGIARLAGVGLTLRRPRWALARSGFLVLTWVSFYASLPVLDLSVAAVAVYTNPILIALLSGALIGERVTGRQWGGVLLGFLGVVAILKPGTDEFSWVTILPLLAAAFYALAVVLTRSKCRDEAPLALALTLHGAFLITGLVVAGGLAVLGPGADTRAAVPFLLGDWGPMDVRDWGMMAFLGALSALYFAGAARAYQIAAPSVIATFDYGYLVSAAVWGFVFFAETPGPLTVAGMVLITMAGLLVAMPAGRKAPAPA